MTEPSELYRAMARIICAQLIPHRTSVHNVSLLAAALTAAEEKGRREAIEALRPFAEIGEWLFAREVPDDTPMVIADGINGYQIILTRGHFKAAHTAIRALAGQPAPAASEPNNLADEDYEEGPSAAAIRGAGILRQLPTPHVEPSEAEVEAAWEAGWDIGRAVPVSTARKMLRAVAKVRAR